MRMQVILDSSFARPGSAPIWGGKKGEFRDWTSVFGDWKVKTDVYVAGLWFLVRFGGEYDDYIHTLGCFSVMVASYEREES